MADVSITQQHTLDIPECKLRLQKFESILAEKFGITLEWDETNRAKIRGKGVSGSLSIDSRQVDVQLALGLLLKPLRPQIHSTLDEKLSKILTA